MKDEIKIYHNPRCSKSRCAISFLEDTNYSIDVVEYLKESPTADELVALLKKLKMNAQDLVRKGEEDFKNNFKGKELSEKQWIDAMVQFPKLIERPIVILGENAVIARPTEKIEELLNKS